MDQDVEERVRDEFKRLVRLALEQRPGKFECPPQTLPDLERHLRCVMDLFLQKGGHIFNVTHSKQQLLLHHSLGPEGRALVTPLDCSVVQSVLEQLTPEK
jgi:hypothetical protein